MEDSITPDAMQNPLNEVSQTTWCTTLSRFHDYIIQVNMVIILDP